MTDHIPAPIEAMTINKPKLARLMTELASRPHIDPQFKAAVEAFEQVVMEPVNSTGPFLSVLLRTQGRREQTLKDSLLCLAAQTDQDFEVIIVEHDATPEGSKMVREVVARQVPSFSSRVRILEVTGGTRARPLNAGIEVVRGQYVAVFDDDDLLFAHWVEEFHRQGVLHPGQVLRAVTAAQNAKIETWPQGQTGFRSISWPGAGYPKEFDQLNHLLVNQSPFMSVAFPSAIFVRFGLRFDEELLVCEDWDMILQATLLCGVIQVDAITSIYRLWVGSETSYTKHAEESWRASEARVYSRINGTVQLLPVGAANRIRQYLFVEDTLAHYGFLFKNGRLRQPFTIVIVALSPLIRFTVRVRNKLRRMRDK